MGEITVAGPTATDSYFNREAATRAAKISERLADGSTRIVHRMGDVGYFDEQGRLWFCGRKTQRVETAEGPLYTEQVEPVFNTHPAIRRTALVGIGEPGHQRPVLCYELLPDIAVSDQEKLVAELKVITLAHPHTACIETFLRHPASVSYTHLDVYKRQIQIRGLPGSFETAGAVMNTIGGIVRYGRPDDYVFKRKAEIESLTPQQIKACLLYTSRCV